MSRHYADPNCPKCKGAGFIYPKSLLVLPGEKGGRHCDCMLDALRLQNMDRVWQGLSKAREIPDLRDNPPLRKLVDRNLWITAPDVIFQAHLKAVAFRMTDMWDAKVLGDNELPASWLGTARASGAKIFDVEVDKSTSKYLTIEDAVVPPGLCIIKLGVKHTPNKESANTLLEAIGIRQHMGKPTWIVDQPDRRIDMEHHTFYSQILEGWLRHWGHVELRGAHAKVAGGPMLISAAADAGFVDEIVSTANNEIEDALSDLDEDEEAEEVEEGEDADDADEGYEDDEEEEEYVAPPKNNLLAEMMENEEKQDKRAYKKKSPRKPNRMGRKG